MSLKSRCNTCGTALSVSAETCINCGDTDPFLKNKILSVQRILGPVTTLPTLGSIAIVLLAFFSAIAYKSWVILIVGIIVGLIWLLGLFNGVIRDKLLEMKKVVVPSFLNFVKENKLGYTDENGAWCAFPEDNVWPAWEVYQLEVIGKPVEISSDVPQEYFLSDLLEDEYRKALKATKEG